MLTQTETQAPAVAKTSAMLVSPQFILPSTKITPQNLPKLKYFISYKGFWAWLQFNIQGNTDDTRSKENKILFKMSTEIFHYRNPMII